MCFSNFLISTQNVGFIDGCPLSSPIIPIHKAPDPCTPPSSGKELQWPRCVSKQSGCEMAEIYRQPSLPPLPLSFQTPVCIFQFSTLGGGMELVFCHSFIHNNKRKGRKESPWCLPLCWQNSLRPYTADDCPRLIVLWETPSVTVVPARLLAWHCCCLTRFIFDSGSQEHWCGERFGKTVLTAHLFGVSGCIQASGNTLSSGSMCSENWGFDCQSLWRGDQSDYIHLLKRSLKWSLPLAGLLTQLIASFYCSLDMNPDHIM